MAEKVVAFVYDNASSEAPVSFGGAMPGEWTPGVPVLPAAFGFTVEQMREAIREYGLPIREQRVAEKDAVAAIDRGLNHLPTSAEGTQDPPKPSDAYRDTADGPIPAPPGTGVHPPLLPLAAAMQARNTVLSNGGTLEEAAAAAREAGGEWGEGIAGATEDAAAAYAEADAVREDILDSTVSDEAKAGD